MPRAATIAFRKSDRPDVLGADDPFGDRARIALESVRLTGRLVGGLHWI